MEGQADRLGLTLDVTVLARVMAVLTLLTPEDEASACVTVRLVADLADADAERCGKIVRWAHALYPGRDGRWLEPLVPDLVAERHVVDQLSVSAPLRKTCMVGLAHGQAVHALTLLARACALDDQAFGLIDQAVRADPSRLAVAAISVAIGSEADVSHRIGQILADVLETAACSREELDAIARAVPGSTTALTDLALIIAVRRLRLLLPDQEAARAVEVRSEAISRLGNAGRWEEAGSVAWAQLRDLLSQVRQDHEFRPFLVIALIDLSKVLADGYADTAGALQANTLAKEIFDRLSAHQQEKLCAVRAQIMSAQCCLLWLNGDPHAAVVAGGVAVSQLSKLSDPDAVKLEGDLATTRYWYAVALSADGQIEKALRQIEEVVASRRKLAGQRRDTFLPDYARSLEAQSLILGKIQIPGAMSMAIDPITEAIACFTELARDHPSFGAELARALHRRAYIYLKLNRPLDSRPDCETAVDILRPLARLEPSAHMERLANCLILSALSVDGCAFAAERLLLARYLARDYAPGVAAKAEALLRRVDDADPAAVQEARAQLSDAAIRSWLDNDGPDATRS